MYFAKLCKHILQFETNMYNEAKKSKVSTEASKRDYLPLISEYQTKMENSVSWYDEQAS